jgi:hypothetical protein
MKRKISFTLKLIDVTKDENQSLENIFSDSFVRTFKSTSLFDD